MSPRQGREPERSVQDEEQSRTTSPERSGKLRGASAITAPVNVHPPSLDEPSQNKDELLRAMEFGDGANPRSYDVL